MKQSIKRPWHDYREAQFLFTQALSQNVSFAIITAHNPKGQTLTASQNRLLDKKLQRDILLLGQPYRAIVGTSEDRQHMEKSWALSTDKPAAIALGCKFNQNAIYYVSDGQLLLVPCLLPQKETLLGDFSSRVNVVYELPDNI